jgi:hypothetical protein
LPPAGELETLLKMAMIGDVVKLALRAKTLAGRDDKYIPFTARLQELTADFKLDELEQFIRDCMEEV